MAACISILKRGLPWLGLTWLVLIVALNGSARADTVVLATPDGTIVTGDTTGLLVGEVNPGLIVDVYIMEETPLEVVSEPATPPGSMKTTLWGYEAAATFAQIHSYTIAPFSVGPTCIPPGSQNGRGVAFDPLDGNLWRTHVTAGFNGDGFIHKNTPPHLGCAPITSIPFAEGPGGPTQDDIGALDVDQGSKHIWAAGYKPVCVGGIGPTCIGSVLRSYLYLVNRNNGKVIHSCWLPFRGGGVGNDTLAYFRDSTLPGSGQYLLTDAGEATTMPNTLAVIDTVHCKNGDQVFPIDEFPKTNNTQRITGIDFEWPGLLNTDGQFIYQGAASQGPTGTAPCVPLAIPCIEDISFCGFRAKLGGDGNDMCPYP